jgi:hypothetical protein
LWRRAGRILLQVVDDAVVRVPGIGVVRLCRSRVAVVDVDLGVGNRGEARDFHVELKLAGHGIIGDELPLQPGGLVACRHDDVGAVGAGVSEQVRLDDRVGDQNPEIGEVPGDQRVVDRDLLAVSSSGRNRPRLSSRACRRR